VVLTENLDQRTRELMDQAAGGDDVETPEAALIAKMEAEEVRKAVASLPSALSGGPRAIGLFASSSA
jgi:hypothetical protein